MVGWPSGLRRQVKALVSSGARVQIPPQPFLFCFFLCKFFLCFFNKNNKIKKTNKKCLLSSDGRALAF